MPPNRETPTPSHGTHEDLYRSRVTSGGGRSPKSMTREQIREEVTSLCETMNLAAQRVQELSRCLYEHSRRTSSWDQTTSAYISYSNAWGRFAAAIQQGIRRTTMMSKTLDRALRSDTPTSSPLRAKPETKKPVSKPSTVFTGAFEQEATLKDLMDLYRLET